MRKPRLACAVISAIVLVAAVGVGPAGAEQMRSGGAANKLGRGAINIFTGWVEIPKRIADTTAEQGAWVGWTWGLLRGIGYGFVRTAAGFYEVLTFPFPAPSGYQPVFVPEYVFTNSDTTSLRK